MKLIDSIITNYFFTKTKSGILRLYNSKILDFFNKHKYTNIINYVCNYYDSQEISSDIFKQNLWRIKLNINTIPRCKVCNKPLKMKLSINPFPSQTCSRRCANNDIDKINNYRYIMTPAKHKQSYEKCMHTISERYGKQSILAVKEFEDKRNETLKNNNTFNTSKSEDKCYELLKSKFHVVLRQYKSKKYPFSCDFYIPDKDLYIEYNGTWTHGNHLFDSFNKDDISKLNEWKEKSKKSRYYKNAIYTWTDLDVRKNNIAKQNNLNYIILWKLSDILNIK